MLDALDRMVLGMTLEPRQVRVASMPNTSHLDDLDRMVLGLPLVGKSEEPIALTIPKRNRSRGTKRPRSNPPLSFEASSMEIDVELAPGSQVPQNQRSGGQSPVADSTMPEMNKGPFVQEQAEDPPRVQEDDDVKCE